MIKRGALIGIGFVLLVIGLAGLALLQAGVINLPASKDQLSLLEVKPPGSTPEGSGRQADLERRQLPGAPESMKQTPEPGSRTAQVPAATPQSSEGPQTTRNPSVAGGSEARCHPSSEALRPVVIRFHFDPAAKREIDVARVHFGDLISVKVRRFGQADLRLHLAFAVPDTVETGAWRGWSAGSRRVVVIPIQDTDRISLTADRDFGVVLTRDLDSKKGAILKLGADYPPGRRSLIYQHERGAYEMEMKIYPGNRWNIKPGAIDRY